MRHIKLFENSKSLFEFTSAEDLKHVETLYNLESLFAVTNVWHHPSEYIRVSNNKFDYILNPKESSRRQDFEKVYFITGALYIVSTSFFKKTQTFITEESKPYILSEETMIDIDNAFHFNLAKAYVKSWLN